MYCLSPIALCVASWLVFCPTTTWRSSCQKEQLLQLHSVTVCVMRENLLFVPQNVFCLSRSFSDIMFVAFLNPGRGRGFFPIQVKDPLRPLSNVRDQVMTGSSPEGGGSSWAQPKIGQTSQNIRVEHNQLLMFGSNKAAYQGRARLCSGAKSLGCIRVVVGPILWCSNWGKVTGRFEPQSLTVNLVVRQNKDPSPYICQ